MPNDDSVLEELKENFDMCVREWEDTRKEGMLDMQNIVDGPWTEKERAERAAADRPCLTFDELGQYLNQSAGDMRQNKRAIKVSPKGDGANDQTAEMRSGMIREVEYKSNAQEAYAMGFTNMIERSYGYLKITTRYCKPGSFDQELRICGIANPDTIYLDPFAREPDWSDMAYGFEFDTFTEKEFEKKWPEADPVSFEAGRIEAPAWITDRIQVASYWRVEKKVRKLLLLDLPAQGGASKVYLDELHKGSKIDGNRVIIAHPKMGSVPVPLLDMRREETPTVVQYITNGLAILERKPTNWIEVPIIPLFGPVQWVDSGSGSKRRMRSMTRKARDAYKSYCYVATGEVEVIGMVPKALLMGYEGQFDTKTPWDKINKVAIPYAEVKAISTGTGGSILPLPERQLYDPPVQSMEMAKASYKLSIQAAMGVGGMLNGQHAQNFDAESGKAMEELDKAEAQGSYVFIAAFERGLLRLGRMADAALDWVYDTEQDVGTRKADDTYSSARINQRDANGNPVGFQTDQGDHGTTISVGPNEASQRDAADEFVETLLGMPGVIQTHPQVVGKAIRLRDLGPIGDQIADIFDPQGSAAPLPPAVQKHMADSDSMIQKLTATVHALQNKIDAKLPEIQSKERMHAQDLDFNREKLSVEASGLAAKIGSTEALDRLKIETGLIAEERGAAAEAAENEAARGHEAGLQGADQAHEAAMAAGAQEHEKGMAASGQAADASSQASDQLHQAGMAQDAQDAAADTEAND